MNDETFDSLSARWYLRVQRHQLAHRFAAKGYEKYHVIIGVPAVVASTVVGGFLFSTSDTKPDDWVKLLIGLLSLVSAVLAALQTFLRFDELSLHHKIADAGFGLVRHKIEAQRIASNQSSKWQDQFLANLIAQIEDLSARSPTIPERFWGKARLTLLDGGLPTH